MHRAIRLARLSLARLSHSAPANGSPRHNGFMDDPLNLNDALPSRYVVGIDLGTTNSAVCVVDTEQTPWQVHVFAVPQLVAPGQVDARETLPSFHYQPLASEAADQGLRLPWQSQPHPYVVGVMARDQGLLRQAG